MNEPLLVLAIDVAAVTCVALVALFMIASHPRVRTAQLIAWIGLNTICHIVLARDDYSAWIPAAFQTEVGAWRPLLNMAQNVTPALFLVLCHTLFGAGRRFPRWLAALIAIQLLLEEPVEWLAPTGSLGRDVTETIPALLQTLFVGLALYWTARDWQGDLIETRRRVRAFTFFVIGFNIIGQSLLLRVVVPPDTIANFHLHAALIAMSIPISAFLLFQLTREDHARLLQPDLPPTPQSAAFSREDAGALARLTALLDEERVYRQPGLTLKGLTTAAALPEYKLRKLIHEQLGYQNFNAFLHHYRIQEACAQLRDPALRRTPILTIALSVGYQSINTFNRGFRDIMNMTPSAYRAMADAPTPKEPSLFAK